MKKYPGQEQVELSVVIRIPGHCFNGMDAAEKAKLFEATAVEYSKCRTFGQGRGMSKAEAIRFQVDSDVADTPSHEGYWIRLDQWNRFRHDTYKTDRQAELRFIPSAGTQVPDTSNADGNKDVSEERAAVYTHYERMGETDHVVR
eukprot:gene34387-biopygen28397